MTDRWDNLLVLADDLTGAAETAAALSSAARPVRVHLGPDPSARHASGMTVVDVDVRGGDHAEAAESMSLALADIDARPVFVKIDSQYRGPVDAYLSAILAKRPEGVLVIVAPALPSRGRTLIDGAARVAGHLVEVAELVSAPSIVVCLSRLRSDDLRGSLAAAASSGHVVICDSELDSDLDRIVSAAARHDAVWFVGSSGLASAIARSARSSAVAPSATPPSRDDLAGADRTPPRCLLIVGSAEPSVRAEIVELMVGGHPVIALDPFDRDADQRAAFEVDRVLRERGVAVLVSPPEYVDGSHDAIARRLSDIAVAAVARVDSASAPTSIGIIGGHTARSVLDRLQSRQLSVVDEIHQGAVRSIDARGRIIVTRPGSFTEPESLARIIDALGGLTTGTGPNAAAPNPAAHDSTAQITAASAPTTSTRQERFTA